MRPEDNNEVEYAGYPSMPARASSRVYGSDTVVGDLVREVISEYLGQERSSFDQIAEKNGRSEPEVRSLYHRGMDGLRYYFDTGERY